VNEQPLNLQDSFREIWRRRMLVTVVAVLCGLGGIIFAVLKPVDPTAVALVLLPPSTTSSSGAPANNTRTDAIIARSAPVLATAGAKVSPPLGAMKLRSLVTVGALSGQVLQIQVQAAPSSYAEQLANAVAASYVKYIGQLETSSSGPGLTALQQESAQLTQQIKDLQNQINTVSTRVATEGAGSSAGERDANLLGSLRNEQNEVSLQLNNVTSQVSIAQVASGSAENNTRILQNATGQPVDKYGFLITAGIVGFAVGLLGSAVFVLVRFQRDRRLRLRGEFARAAGAPVLASLEAPSCTTPSAWRDFLESQPRATAEWALRHLLHTLLNGGGQRSAVRVISFAGDSPALTTGPRLALHAAASGTPTALVPEDTAEPEDRSLVPLRAAFTGAEPVGRGLPFTIGLDDMGDDPPQLLVSIAIFDGKSATFGPSDGMNLLSISPSFVTADELAHLALEAADAGSALDGVVVVNPDPTDNTTGLIADDTLRVLPSGASAEGGHNGPARLGPRISNANGSPERLSSQER
jgi:capsular polysaccharide biosynthesis protein